MTIGRGGRRGDDFVVLVEYPDADILEVVWTRFQHSVDNALSYHNSYPSSSCAVFPSNSPGLRDDVPTFDSWKVCLLERSYINLLVVISKFAAAFKKMPYFSVKYNQK